jgi:hypothetical protein
MWPRRKFRTGNQVDWYSIRVISFCLSRISENVHYKLEKKFNTKIWCPDGIRVMLGAVNAQYTLVCLTTIVLYSSTHPTTSLCKYTCCGRLTLWQVLIVSHANRGELTRQGKWSKLGSINPKLVYESTCCELTAESAGMWQRYVIHRSENMCIPALDLERPPPKMSQWSVHDFWSWK